MSSSLDALASLTYFPLDSRLDFHGVHADLPQLHVVADGGSYDVITDVQRDPRSARE